MNPELKGEDNSTVAQNDASRLEDRVDSRGAWRRPVHTLIDIKRTMAVNGAYLDGGSGYSF